MEQNILDDKTKSKKKTGYLTLRNMLGCGCGCCILLPFGLVSLLLMPFFFPEWFISSGEHLPTAEHISPEATNYSYYDSYMYRIREFDIPVEAFLEMCKKRKRDPIDPIAIEMLPDLPPFDHSKDMPWINVERSVPLTIGRYLSHKEEHGECNHWQAECKVDPTGKTDDSCFRSVSQGHYFEIQLSNGGGYKVLYDSENGRCYTCWIRR